MSIISLTLASGILALGITSVVSPMLKMINHGDGPECGLREVITNKLIEQYKEQSIAFSINEPDNALIELYKSKDGATWTIVMTNAQTKNACIMAYGTDWNTREVTFSKEQKL